MSYDTAAQPVRRSLIRRFLVPVLAIIPPIIAFTLINVFVEYDLAPDALFPLFMIAPATVLLAVIVIGVWYLFFSGFSWLTKIAGIVVVVGGFAALYAVTAKMHVTGNMGMRFRFIWEPDPVAALEERIKSQEGHEVPKLTLADLTPAPDDFPGYRGRAGDGVATAVPIANDWSAHPPKRVWEQNVGWAYSGLAVAGKVAITLEQRKDHEAVVCYDRADGKELWAHSYEAEFKHSPNMGGGGPRSTPTIAEGDVYTLGAKGDLVCLDGTTGKPRWSTNCVKDSAAKVIEWGMTGSPLIVGNYVVVNPGIDPKDNRDQAVAAYDRKTGKRVWAQGLHGAGYSSPQLAKLGGLEQIVLFDAGGLAGIDPADGRELWRKTWNTFSDMNIIQPVVVPGDRIFISSELTNGCALLKITKDADAWSVEQVWQNRNMASKFANPIYHNGHVYGLHSSYLTCIELETGKRKWKDGARFGSGQLLLTGDTLLVQSEDPTSIVAVAADPSGYREIGRMEVFAGKTWNTPALAGGRLYLRNHESMVCVELYGQR